MTLINHSCYHNGCACYDPNKQLLAVKQVNEWVGLTAEEIIIMSRYDLEYAALIGEVERKLKEKNTNT